jgi:hypothetical protein
VINYYFCVHKAHKFTIASCSLQEEHVLCLSSLDVLPNRCTHFLIALQPLWALATFQSPDLFTIDRTPWTRDQLIARPLPKHRTAQTQNKHIYTHQTSMAWVGFEPTIRVSQQAKTVHVLDHSATVTRKCTHTLHQITQSDQMKLAKMGATSSIHTGMRSGWKMQLENLKEQGN